MTTEDWPQSRISKQQKPREFPKKSCCTSLEAHARRYPVSPSPLGDIHIMSKHKEAAKSFLKIAGTGKVQEAYDEYVAPSFIHHNQYLRGDRQSLLTAMQEASKTTPNKSIEIKHVYEDGDTVITHSLVTRQDAEAPDIAVVHIFRFEQDRVAELWDVGQPISAESPNENGMF
jgi:predicted SnoaL-like aldol condensation-catalyzing enzyme